MFCIEEWDRGIVDGVHFLNVCIEDPSEDATLSILRELKLNRGVIRCKELSMGGMQVWG